MLVSNGRRDEVEAPTMSLSISQDSKPKEIQKYSNPWNTADMDSSN